MWTAVTVLLASLAAPAIARAGAPGWGSEESVEPDDLIPKMASAEAYNERYTLKSKLDNGGLIVTRFTISNVGFFDGGAKASVKIEWPERPTYKYKQTFESDEWSYANDHFELKMGNTRVRARDDQTFVVHHQGRQNGKKLELEFVLRSDTDMWSPGSGDIETGNGYYSLDFISLRSDASGSFRVGDESHEIEGTNAGYGEHGATNVAPFRLANHIASGRVYNDDRSIFFIWRRVQLADGYGGAPVTFLLVGHNGEIVFADAAADATFGRVRKDPKTGYGVPHSVQIEGSDGDDSAKLVLRSKEVDRKNLLERYGQVVQTFASAFTEPYHYGFNGTYGLELDIEGTRATVRGEGGYMADFF